MKIDRIGVFDASFFLIAGILLALSGCASAPEETATADGGARRDFPERPLEAPAHPQSLPVPSRIDHRPEAPIPEMVLHVPSPEPAVEGVSSRIAVLPMITHEATPPEATAQPGAQQELPETVLPQVAPPSVPGPRERPVPIPEVSRPATSQPEYAWDGRFGESQGSRDTPERRAGVDETREPDPSGATVTGSQLDVVTPRRFETPSPLQSQSQSLPEPREDTVAERTVEEGERFEVALPGRGWIYLGGGEALQFLDRAIQGEDVVFSFRGPPTGTATDERAVLEFESQNLSTGSRTRHEEQILVAETEGTDRDDESSPVDSRSVTVAADAVTTEASAAGGIAENFENASSEELLRRVDEFEASADYEAAADVLEAMRDEAIGNDDEISFRLAQLYEAEWDGRDLSLARDLYRRVVENYPLSRWRRRARERIEYLNRHFFHIR